MAGVRDQPQRLRGENAGEVAGPRERVALAEDDPRRRVEPFERIGRVAPVAHRCERAHDVARVAIERPRACAREQLFVGVLRERGRADPLPQRREPLAPHELDLVVAAPARARGVGLAARALGQQPADALRRLRGDRVGDVPAHRRADERQLARMALEQRVGPGVDRVAELVEERRLGPVGQLAPHPRVEGERVQEERRHDASMLKVYDAARCPYCARVRILLTEKGVEHELVPLDLDDRPDWLWEKNPLGKVPVLEEGGFVLPESVVIMEYLEERYPTPALLPTDPAARALSRLAVARFDNALGNAYYARRRGEAGAEERLAECLGHLERRTAAWPRAFGWVDVAYLPWLLRARDVLGAQLGPAVTERIERFAERPSVAAELAVVAAL